MNFVFFAENMEIFRPVSGVYLEFRRLLARLAGGPLWTAPAAN
jgi:hypothetical protein